MPFVGSRRALLQAPPPTPFTYQFQDRFMTDAAAPLTTPRNAEPGPGALTIVDTNSIMSVNGQQLLFNGVCAVADRLGPAATLARVAGRCLLQYYSDFTQPGLTSGTFRFGWDTVVNASTLTYGFDFQTTSYRIKSATTAMATINIAHSGSWWGVMMRATGALGLHRASGSGPFTVEWVYALSNAALFHKIYLATAETRTIRLDTWEVIDFPAPFTTDAAIATTLTASPATGATGQMKADALVEFTWTVAALEVLELDVRRTDASNRWIVRCDQLAGTIKLIEMNAGVETERASSSQTWTALSVYRILVTCDAITIKNWVGLSSTDALTAKNSYTAATFQRDASGIAVAGFATGANLIAWPRYLTLPGI